MLEAAEKTVSRSFLYKLMYDFMSETALHRNIEQHQTVLSNTDPSGETNPNKFLLHPLLSAEPDLNPVTNSA